jgi:antitoxin (DNA-binding transcriptional repressor) of toxin-antitoxin stability system
MHTVTLEEARTHLPELVAEAAAGGEILITENDKPVAKLAAPPPVPSEIHATGRWPGFGLLKGKMEIAPDFDEPLEEFREYME